MSDDITAQRLTAALSFIRRGWPVIMLHDVSMGYCSCGDTSEQHMNSSAGKHPIARQWQLASLVDEDYLRTLFAGRPAMNFGIRTGLTAGVWVLDVDPKHGGDLRLAELIKEHGELPDTYSVRTGSGGVHYFFCLPEDFTPTNSRGSLPAGLDVRGEGGFVVGAPSRSGIGPYEVLQDLPVAGAPGWLLEMIRPRVPFDVEHRAALEQWDNPGAAWSGDRGQRYAYAAMLAELGKLSNAVPGTRGFTAYQVACNLIELLNSPWAQLEEDYVRGAYLSAARAAQSLGGGFDDREAWSSWSSAAKRIGARGRAAPAAGGGVLVGWSAQGGVSPFGSPGEVPNTLPDPVGPSIVPTFPLGSPFSGPAGQSPIDHGPLSGPVSPSPLSPVDLMRSMFITGDQLAELPPPLWLIDGWLVRDSTVQMIGKPEEGKSFVALDMAMCIADGRPWRGNRVHQGHVAYVIAEGAAGMGQRYKAWCKHFNEGASVPGIHFLPMPVQVTDHAAWDALITACVQLGVVKVVLDTQARVTVGLDENSAKEMGLFVEQVERLRRATRACIEVVHHKGKTGDTARGSGALLGAVTTEITVSRAAEIVTVKVTKQKDAERSQPVDLQLKSIETMRVPRGDPASWAGVPDEVITAGVLVDVDAYQAAQWEGVSSQGKILKVMGDLFAERGETKTAIQAMCLVRAGLAKTSFYRAWDKLESGGIVIRVLIEDRVTNKWIISRLQDRTPTQT